MVNKPVVLLDPNFRKISEVFHPADLERIHGFADIVWGRDEKMPAEEARRALAEATAVVCSGWSYGDILDDAPNLRAILDVSGSFPLDLDYEKCFSRSIRVLSAASAFGRQVAEMALGMALSLTREIAIGDRDFREGNEKWLHSGNRDTFLLFGQSVGLIGYGGLARALRPLLEPFGVKLSVFDPWLGEGYLRSIGLKSVGLEELLSTSKVIFVLAVPSSENSALISRELLEKIQPGSVFALISRAHVVDFDALTEMVLQERFKAAIDVFPTEPLPLDHPIRGARYALLSAHRAGSVPSGLYELGEMVADDLEMILKNLPPMRLQRAEPELSRRYVSTSAKKPIEKR